MSELWLHADHVVCTHPGWPSLRGWAPWWAPPGFAVPARGPDAVHLDQPPARVHGTVGWVTVDENLITGSQTQTVAALNLFEHVDGAWRLVVHQGTGIARS